MSAVAYIAKHEKDGPTLAKTVSKEYDISLMYLRRILSELVRYNILRSMKGSNGGFYMARPSKEINTLEVVEAVSGPMTSYLELRELTNNAPFSRKMEKLCIDATDKSKAILRKAKVSDMIS